MYSVAVARHALSRRSKGQRLSSHSASKVSWCCRHGCAGRTTGWVLQLWHDIIAVCRLSGEVTRVQQLVCQPDHY